ncbi:MAG: hypothetical protein WHT06_02875 [Desulfobacterales bacterium]
MGFFRRREEELALRILRWQLARRSGPPPAEAELRRHAARIVEEAHRIGRERGGNLVDILKELAREMLARK